MAVPTSINDLSALISANSPSGTDPIGSTVDDFLRAMQGILKEATASLYTAGGTADAITFTTTPVIPAYQAGGRYKFLALGANTGAVTVNINGLGAKALLKDGSSALTAGDITAANTVVDIVYDGTQFQLLNKQYVPPAGGLAQSGAIMPYAMNSAPSGWLSCDGSAVSRTTYADLFTAIGTTWGAGNGATTFNIPDLRGYFLRGSGTNSDGAVSGAFATKIADTYGNHSHTASVTDPGHTHSYTAPSRTQVRTDALQADLGLNTGAANTGSNATGISVTVNTSTTGGTETQPKNIAVLYCIKT